MKCFAITFITGNGKLPQSGWFLRLVNGLDRPTTLHTIQIDAARILAYK